MAFARTAGAAALILGLAGPALAGRPLATDNAETAPVGTCELEVWHERADDPAGDYRGWIVSPVCGLNEGIEVGLDVGRARVGSEHISGAGLFMKLVPESWEWDSPIGEVAFGLKLDAGGSRASGQSWRLDGYGALMLASWEFGEGFTVHANLGPQHDRETSRNSTMLNLALTWEPSEQVLLFGELMSNDRRSLNGGTVRTLGARWWLVPEVFGLDLTASRENGGQTSTLWTVGIGWYGLSF